MVADHYRGVDPETMRAETAPAERLAYVSYRKNDRVFWTKNKARIYEGETILTDGQTESADVVATAFRCSRCCRRPMKSRKRHSSMR